MQSLTCFLLAEAAQPAKHARERNAIYKGFEKQLVYCPSTDAVVAMESSGNTREAVILMWHGPSLKLYISNAI